MCDFLSLTLYPLLQVLTVVSCWCVLQMKLSAASLSFNESTRNVPLTTACMSWVQDCRNFISVISAPPELICLSRAEPGVWGCRLTGCSVNSLRFLYLLLCVCWFSHVVAQLAYLKIYDSGLGLRNTWGHSPRPHPPCKIIHRKVCVFIYINFFLFSNSCDDRFGYKGQVFL